MQDGYIKVCSTVYCTMWLLFVFSYFLFFSHTGKSFQQQREAMKQTIEEDKEPEKSGQFHSNWWHSVHLHDTHENRITGVVELWSDF